jgi:hypothetical protein
MKVIIVDSGLIKLYPENDADQALLGMWTNGTARIASSSWEANEVLQMMISFHAFEKKKEEDQ